MIASMTENCSTKMNERTLGIETLAKQITCEAYLSLLNAKGYL